MERNSETYHVPSYAAYFDRPQPRKLKPKEMVSVTEKFLLDYTKYKFHALVFVNDCQVVFDDRIGETRIVYFDWVKGDIYMFCNGNYVSVALSKYVL